MKNINNVIDIISYCFDNILKEKKEEINKNFSFFLLNNSKFKTKKGMQAFYIKFACNSRIFSAIDFIHMDFDEQYGYSEDSNSAIYKYIQALFYAYWKI